MTYAQRFASELGSLVDSAKALLDEIEGLGDDIPLALKSAWSALYSALEPFGVVEPFQDAHGPHGEPESVCKGFQWIGQSWEHCNGCGRPAWEHEGYEEVGASNPFTDEGVKITPWTGLIAEVRENYLKGVRIEVHGPEGGDRAIVYVK